MAPSGRGVDCPPASTVSTPSATRRRARSAAARAAPPGPTCGAETRVGRSRRTHQRQHAVVAVAAVVAGVVALKRLLAHPQLAGCLRQRRGGTGRSHRRGAAEKAQPAGGGDAGGGPTRKRRT